MDLLKPSDFRPAFWLPGPHFQTIWASKFRKIPMPNLEKEQLELEDGDFLQLFWALEGNGPMVIILHGLEVFEFQSTFLTIVFVCWHSPEALLASLRHSNRSTFLGESFP